VRVLFLFSLPRSGSTLLQRLLAAQPEIATNSEGWLALPLLYALRPDGADAEYGHRAAAVAIEELCEQLPGGHAEYLEATRDFLLRLYGSAAGERRYFLDKTPRYHLVADELVTLFPEAKPLFLWRNPLAVAASLIDSWNDGNWNLDVHAIDLFDGVETLTGTYSELGDRALSVRYEDLVQDPDRELARITDWLGLPRAEPVSGPLPPGRLGALGDMAGTFRYREISKEPVDKWHATLANPLRRAWARRYLRWIGNDRLALMGYDGDALFRALAASPATLDHLAGDVARNGSAAWYRLRAATAAGRRRRPWSGGETGWR
jgi:hypothetical protein